ncbi:unnamed protein product [Heterosigma akashiwo]
MWAVDAGPLGRAAQASRREGEGPFADQLEGGRGGEAHRELVDYFYYCQLRAQGEDTTEERRAEGRVKLAELPNLMRALGHYPSEAAVAEMVAEVKYSRFTATGGAGGPGPSGLGRLFVNHRPVALGRGGGA